MKTGEPTGHTDDQRGGAGRSCGAFWLWPSPTPDIAERIARPALPPGLVQYDDE